MFLAVADQRHVLTDGLISRGDFVAGLLLVLGDQGVEHLFEGAAADDGNVGGLCGGEAANCDMMSVTAVANTAEVNRMRIPAEVLA